MEPRVKSRSARRHRHRRIWRWLRAGGPLLLLLAAGLLSAGVVHVVELVVPAHGMVPDARPTPVAPPRGPAGRLDPDSFDSELYEELRKLQDEERDLSLGPGFSEPELLMDLISRSLLGGSIMEALAPFEAEVRANALFEGPEQAARDLDERPGFRNGLVTPEPGTGVLIALGVGVLRRRALPFI